MTIFPFAIYVKVLQAWLNLGDSSEAIFLDLAFRNEEFLSFQHP